MKNKSFVTAINTCNLIDGYNKFSNWLINEKLSEKKHKAAAKLLRKNFERLVKIMKKGKNFNTNKMRKISMVWSFAVERNEVSGNFVITSVAFVEPHVFFNPIFRVDDAHEEKQAA